MNTEIPKKILVATDFSEASYAAFPYAVDIAKGSNSVITIVNVADFPPIAFNYEHFPTPAEVNAVKNETKLNAEKKLRDISGNFFKGITTCEVVLESFEWSADAIVDFANKEKQDLIIIATQGHGFLGRLFLGSVTARILRQITCPVLVVPSREEGTNSPTARLPYKKIAALTDLSEASKAAFPMALLEAKRSGAKLVLAHVAERQYAPEFERLQAGYLRDLEEELSKYLASFQDVSVRCQVIPASRSVANSVTEYAKNEGMDLLIATPRGAGNRISLLGGVIERILRQSSCPVLVVPPKSNDPK